MAIGAKAAQRLSWHGTHVGHAAGVPERAARQRIECPSICVINISCVTAQRSAAGMPRTCCCCAPKNAVMSARDATPRSASIVVLYFNRSKGADTRASGAARRSGCRGGVSGQSATESNDRRRQHAEASASPDMLLLEAPAAPWSCGLSVHNVA